MCGYEYGPGDDVREFVREYNADQRKLSAGGRHHPCPDCGRENALSDEEKRRGYHCGACTRAAEQGW